MPGIRSFQAHLQRDKGLQKDTITEIWMEICWSSLSRKHVVCGLL